jgi:hypothetical protein
VFTCSIVVDRQLVAAAANRTSKTKRRMIDDELYCVLYEELITQQTNE